MEAREHVKTTAPAYVVRPDDAPAYWQIRNLWHVVATGVQTGGSFCAIDQLVNTDGGGPPTHYHTQDEGMYIIRGHCSYSAAGESLLAGAGSFVSIPRYTQHSFVVDAPDTRFLNFYLPAGFDALLMGLSVPALRNELPTPDDHVPLPPRRLVEQLSRDYGAVPIIALPFADHPTPANMVTKPTAAAAVPPRLSTASSGPSFWYGGGLWSILADAASSGGSYCLFEQILPQGPVAPAHLHETMDEVVFVLGGELDVLLEDRLEHVPSDTLVFIPRGTVHAFRVSSQTATLLNLYTPAGMERLLAAEGQSTERRVLPAAAWKPPSLTADQREALCSSIGLRTLAINDPF